MKFNLRSTLFQVALGTVFFLVILALPAIGCASIKSSESSVFYVLTPLYAAQTYMYGLPLLGIICIESFIIYQRERISCQKAFFITGVGNIVYLFLGFFSLNSTIYSIGAKEIGSNLISSLIVNYGSEILIGSAILVAMSLSFCQRTGYFKYLSQGLFVFIIYLFFISLGFAELLMVETINISTPIPFLYAGTAGIFLIRFIINFVIKGYALSLIFKLIFKKKSPSLADTVISMQVWSCPTIAIAYYLWSLQGFY